MVTHVIPVFGKLKQEDCLKFEARLAYIVNLKS